MSDVTDPKIWKAGEYKESELAAITQQDQHDATEEEMLAVSDVPTTKEGCSRIIIQLHNILVYVRDSLPKLCS